MEYMTEHSTERYEHNQKEAKRHRCKKWSAEVLEKVWQTIEDLDKWIDVKGNKITFWLELKGSDVFQIAGEMAKKQFEVNLYQKL